MELERTPQNVRREQTKKKIVTAAKDLFSQCDYFQTTSKDIAKAAGVSIGSFYTYFENKKEVMIEILNDYMNATLHSSSREDAESEQSEELTKSLQMIIHTCFAMHDFPQGFYKNVTILSILDEEIGAMFRNYEHIIKTKIKEILINQNPSLSPEQLEAAGIILYSAVKGSIHEIQFQENHVDESQLTEELVRFLHAYILSQA